MTPDSDDAGVRAAERAARTSYGRLLAYLARAFRDVSAAEDALGEAFARALETWPLRGVPENPEAWLMRAAKNRLLDAAKAGKVRANAVATLLTLADETAPESPMIPDKRLELMFVCAHPAIDAAARTPLMLQTVLGLDAARIASSFLVSPAAMGQRLARAKNRIRDSGIRFASPESDEIAERSESVREAIFAAYGTGWDSLGGADAARKGLSTEAIWLARVLIELTQDDAEALGLLALMLYCEARAKARIVDGEYVPIRVQNTALWDRTMLREAEERLGSAAMLKNPGRFQVEAAIQSATVQSILTQRPMPKQLLALHRALVSFAPTIGNLVGLAAAAAEAEGPEAGLDALDAIEPARTRIYQPYWAVRAHLLVEAKADLAAIETAYRNAIGLCEDSAMRAFLQGRLTSLSR